MHVTLISQTYFINGDATMTNIVYLSFIKLFYAIYLIFSYRSHNNNNNDDDDDDDGSVTLNLSISLAHGFFIDMHFIFMHVNHINQSSFASGDNTTTINQSCLEVGYDPKSIKEVFPLEGPKKTFTCMGWDSNFEGIQGLVTVERFIA